jgi:hypothetical protein
VPPCAITDLAWQVTFVVNDVNAQRPATFHITVRAPDGTKTDTDVFNAVNGNVPNNNMWSAMDIDAHITTLNIRRLDGNSAGVDHAVTGTHWQGQNGSSPILQGAVVVSFKTALSGRTHRGRSYIPFIGENVSENGTIASGQLSIMQPAWNTFLSAMQSDDYPLGVASCQTDQLTDVTSCVVRPYLKTQRRRARR